MLKENKKYVTDVYTGIITQALRDWEMAERGEKIESKKPFAIKREIRQFFRSEWGKQIIDVLELDFKTINNKLHILPELLEKED